MNEKYQFNKDQLDKNHYNTDQSQLTQFGKDYENKLMKYIDIPYFKNNPSYIDQWRRYYTFHKDPHILLLMYHKNISVYYHWLYIELSKHFIRVGKSEIANFVLEHAIKNNVYDRNRLVEALSHIPKFEKSYSKYDMYCVLQQKNIRALGMIWNTYDEVHVYEKYKSETFINFELMKTQEYLNISNDTELRKTKIEENNFIKTQRDDLIITTSYNRKVEEIKNESETSFEIIDEETENFTNVINKKIKNEIISEKKNNNVKFELNNKSDTISNNIDEISNNIDNKNNNIDEISNNIDNKNNNIDEISNKIDKTSNNIDNTSNNIDEISIKIDNTNNKIDKTSNNINEISNKIDKTSNNIDNMSNKSYTMTNNTVDIVKILVESGQYKIFKIYGNLELNREIVINEYVHLIQEIGDTYYISLRIAKESDITETILGKTFCLKKIRYNELKMLDDVRKYEFCVNGLSELFVMFECDRLESLYKILVNCDAVTAGYYLSRILEIVNVFLKHGYVLNNSIYWVDLQFEILLMDFDVSERNEVSFSKLIAELDALFGKFGYKINEETIKNLSEKIGKILKMTENKKKILQHKADILNSI